jgi:hypothetical protein
VIFFTFGGYIADMKILRVLLVLSVFLPELVSAQSFYATRRERSLILTAGVGTSTYLGELKDDGFHIDAKPNFNVGLQYFFFPRIAARVEFNYFRLAGSDAKDNSPERVTRNLSFFSNNYEFSLTGQVNLFPNQTRFYQRPFLNVYGLLGAGVMHMNPKAELDGKKYALQPLQTEGVKYSRIQPVIIYGIGGKIKAGPFFNISLEAAWRKMFTDYLDDVSTVHKDPASFSNPIAARLADRRPEIGLATVAPGYIRGNPDKDDAYILFNMKVEFYLPDNFIFRNSGGGQRKLYSKKRKAFYKKR